MNLPTAISYKKSIKRGESYLKLGFEFVSEGLDFKKAM